jgi:NADP-dependent 3-hydroxy acid dehydrogenase YdfG
MVNIKEVRASNALLKDSQYGTNLVAVFAGATKGIGMGALKAFAKQTKFPKAYIAVRSIEAATPLLKELETSNPEGSFILYETEISLMKNVDKMCDEIKAKEKKVDILFLTPADLIFGKKKGKSFGINSSHIC